MFIDTHAHYDLKSFNGDRSTLLAQLQETGIEYIINAAISYESNINMRHKLQQYDWIYYTVGIHPNCVGMEEIQDEIWEKGLLKVLSQGEKTVAIGETGLDYHRLVRNMAGEFDEESEMKRTRQYKWFHKQIKLAAQLKLPLILHIREAHRDALCVLKEYQDILPAYNTGVVHCFTGNMQEAMEYIHLGYCLGIGGAVTRKENEALREAVGEVPLSRILLETDAPYVMPEGVEGKRNTSLNLPLIAAEIARLKNVSLEEVERVTTENAKRLFGGKFE